MNRNKGVNLGIIGLGRISKYWINAIDNHSQMKLIAASDLDSSKSPSDKGITFYQSADDMLSHEQELDAVIVASPTHDHFESGIKVLESGNHLIMEKPSAESFSQFTKLLEISRKQSALFYNAFHFIHSPEIVWFLGQLESLTRRMGSPSSFYSAFFDEYFEDGKLKSGTGSLVGSWLDSGINAISILFSIFPGLTLDTALIGNGIEGELSDIVSTASFWYPRMGSMGGRGNLVTSWAIGSSLKFTEIFFGDVGKEVRLDHSAQTVTLSDSTGEGEILYAFRGENRLQSHYNGLINELFENLIDETDNSERASSIYSILFEAV